MIHASTIARNKSPRRSNRKRRSPTEWWKTNASHDTFAPRDLSTSFSNEEFGDGQSPTRSNGKTDEKHGVPRYQEVLELGPMLCSDTTSSPTKTNPVGGSLEENAEILVLKRLQALSVCNIPVNKDSSRMLRGEASLHQGECSLAPSSPTTNLQQLQPNFCLNKVLRSPPGAPRKPKRENHPNSLFGGAGETLSNEIRTPLFQNLTSATECHCRNVERCTCVQSADVANYGPEIEGLCLSARRTDLKYTLVRGPSGFFKVATGLSLDEILTGELLLPPNYTTGVRIAEDHNEFYILRHGVLECDYAMQRVRLHEGDIFAVPHSTCFEMKNISSTEAVISFFSSKAG